MRTQQRNFVVEYKSGRRRLADQTNSIWGKTDISSLLREAEASHGFNNEIVSLEKAKPERALEEPVMDENTAQIVTADSQQFPASPVVMATASEALVVEQTVADTSQPAAEILPDAPVSKSTPPQKVKRRTIAANVTNTPKNSWENSAMEGDTDELEKLERENRTLKLALVDHLRNQNAWLRDMLERLDEDWS